MHTIPDRPGLIQSARPRQVIDELARLNLQPVRDLEQVVEADAALATLDLAEERPVDAAAVSQRFLGQAFLLAKTPDPGTELNGGRSLRLAWCGRHEVAKPIRLMRNYPENNRLNCYRLGRNRPVWSGHPDRSAQTRTRQ